MGDELPRWPDACGPVGSEGVFDRLDLGWVTGDHPREVVFETRRVCAEVFHRDGLA